MGDTSAGALALELAQPDRAQTPRGRPGLWQKLTHGEPTRVLLTWLLIVVIVAAALYAGVKFRRWTFEITTPIRFGDIYNGHGWGEQAYEQGYFDLYEIMGDEQPGAGRWLDYAPLRLLLMRQWGAWLDHNYGHDAEYRPGDWTFNSPYLIFNTAMEIVAALAAFLVVVVWVRRGDLPAPEARWRSWLVRLRRKRRGPELIPAAGPRAAPVPTPLFRGYFRGMVAALLVWFSPAIVLSAHGWPTWDMWVIPFFLIGVLLASTEWWFCCGVAIGIGAMFKGQQLFCASIFLLWPLFQLRFGAAGRFLCGLLISMALIASPWLITYHPGHNLAVPRVFDFAAIAWVGGLALAVVVASVLMRMVWRRSTAVSEANDRGAGGADTGIALAPDAAAEKILTYRRARPGERHWPLAIRLGFFLAGIALLAVAVTWPAWGNWPLVFGRGLEMTAVLVAMCALLPLRHARYTACGVAGIALLLTMVYFNGTTGWYKCSFVYGTVHWEWMVMGQTSNLPGILQLTYGWKSVHDVVFNIPAHWVFGLWPAAVFPVEVKPFLFAIFVVLLVFSCMAIALHDRMNSTKFLVAVTTPWVLFFTIPAQIHERYLLYAAGVGMIAVGYSYGMMVLGLFLTLTTWVMTIHVMLNNPGRVNFLKSWGPDVSKTLYKYIHNSHPGIGWAVCLACGIYLWVTLTPDRRKLRAPRDV